MKKMQLDQRLLKAMGFNTETATQISVAVNLHNDLVQIARQYSAIMETEYSDFKEKKRVDEIIARAEVIL